MTLDYKDPAGGRMIVLDTMIVVRGVGQDVTILIPPHVSEALQKALAAPPPQARALEYVTISVDGDARRYTLQSSDTLTLPRYGIQITYESGNHWCLKPLTSREPTVERG